MAWFSYPWPLMNPDPSGGDLGFVDQRGLLDRIGLAALGPLGSDIVRADVAAPVRTEIGRRLDERSRIGDDVEDALVERLGRDRLGHEFGDAGIARGGDALLF